MNRNCSSNLSNGVICLTPKFGMDQEENQEGMMTLNLDTMTTQDKMEAMERLWDDLCRGASEMDSPAWHEGVLLEREHRVKVGEDALLDWEQAKRDIRNSLSLG